MTSRHGKSPASAGRLPTIGVVVAVAALLLSFFAQGLGVFLALGALVIAVVVLVRALNGRPGRQPGLAALVTAVVALAVAGATSGAGQPAVAPAAAPAAAPDPNALPATVTVASAQSPDNLVATTGRLLHVTGMQGRPAPSPCAAASELGTATTLVVGRTVQIAAPDPARTDVPQAVPAGFLPVVLTLPDGRDYAQAWAADAPRAAASCTAAEPARTTTTTTRTRTPTTTTAQDEPDVDPDVDVDVERRSVPDPPRARSGQSGHPCLPGERDGDKDGFCGE